MSARKDERQWALAQKGTGVVSKSDAKSGRRSARERAKRGKVIYQKKPNGNYKIKTAL